MSVRKRKRSTAKRSALHAFRYAVGKSTNGRGPITLTVFEAGKGSTVELSKREANVLAKLLKGGA